MNCYSKEELKKLMKKACEDPQLYSINYPQLFDDFKCVIYMIKKNGMSLKYVSERLKNDVKIVSVAIRQNPDEIQFASDEMQNKLKENAEKPSILKEMKFWTRK